MFRIVYLVTIIIICLGTQSGRAQSLGYSDGGLFASHCGQVPLRLVADRIELRPRKKIELPGGAGHVYYSFRYCDRHIPCKVITKEKSITNYVNHILHQAGDRFLRSQHYTADAIGVVLPASILPRSLTQDDVLKIGENSQILHADPDLPFHEALRQLGRDFVVSLTDHTCPLPRKFQGDLCSDQRLPYDPTESVIDRNFEEFQRRGDYQNADIGKQLFYDQEYRGYSYMVVYKTRSGEVVLDSLAGRHTSNLFVLLRAATRPPCPGWKISKFAINSHSGYGPNARYLVKLNERRFKLENTGQLSVASVYARAEEILKNYAQGAQVIVNACKSLQRNEVPEAALGNIFVSLDPARNPIASVRGGEGTVTNFSNSPDSRIISSDLGNTFGIKTDDLTKWWNPRFRSSPGKEFPTAKSQWKP